MFKTISVRFCKEYPGVGTRQLKLVYRDLTLTVENRLNAIDSLYPTMADHARAVVQNAIIMERVMSTPKGKAFIAAFLHNIVRARVTAYSQRRGQ